MYNEPNDSSKLLTILLVVAAILGGCYLMVGNPDNKPNILVKEIPCASSNTDCKMEDGKTDGKCNDNLICVNCLGKEVNETFHENRFNCTALVCEVNAQHQHYASIVQKEISGCK